MKKTILTAAVLALLSSARVYAYDNGDFQIWNTDVEEFTVAKDSKIAFEEEFRWGNNAHEFYYQHYDAGYFYDLRKWLNVGGGYRQVYELVSKKFKAEDEPYVTATLFGDLNGFKLDDRSRMEYRIFHYKGDSWRYRNKATVKFPWKFGPMAIQPYLSDELFVVFGGVPGDLNQNRFYSGVGMNLTKSLKADLYYMLQSTKSSSTWTDANVLGIKFKIAF